MKALTNCLILILCCGFYFVACTPSNERETIRGGGGKSGKNSPVESGKSRSGKTTTGTQDEDQKDFKVDSKQEEIQKPISLSQGKNKLSQEMIRIVNIMDQVANVYDQTMHVANMELKAVSGKPRMKSFMKFLARAMEKAARSDIEQGNMKTDYHPLRVMSYYSEEDKCKKTAISFYLAKGEIGKYPQDWKLYRFNCQNRPTLMMSLNIADEQNLSFGYSIDSFAGLIDMGNFESMAKAGTGCRAIQIDKDERLRSFTCKNVGQAVSSGKTIALGRFQFDREGKLKTKESPKTYMIDARARIFKQFVAYGTKTILVPLVDKIEVKTLTFSEPDKDQEPPPPPSPQPAPLIPVPTQAQPQQSTQAPVDSAVKDPNQMQTEDMNKAVKPVRQQAPIQKVNCTDLSPEECAAAHQQQAAQVMAEARAQLQGPQNPEEIDDAQQGAPASPQVPAQIVQQDANGNISLAPQSDQQSDQQQDPQQGEQSEQEQGEPHDQQNEEGLPQQEVQQQQGSFLNPGQNLPPSNP